MVNYTLYYCEERRKAGSLCPGMGKLFRATNRFSLVRQHTHAPLAGNIESQILRVIFLFYLQNGLIFINFRHVYTKMLKLGAMNQREVLSTII